WVPVCSYCSTGAFAALRSSQGSVSDSLCPPPWQLTEPLRPGESHTTDFVFEAPRDAHGLRLLITEDDPETRLVIGHETSLGHKKIYFDVDSAQRLTGTAR